MDHDQALLLLFRFYHTILTNQVNLNKKIATPPSGEMELTGRGTIVDYPLLGGIALSFSAKSTIKKNGALDMGQNFETNGRNQRGHPFVNE